MKFAPTMRDFGIELPILKERKQKKVASPFQHRRRRRRGISLEKAKKSKKGNNEYQLKGCVGVGLKLRERQEKINPYSNSCSLRCRHPHQTSPCLIKNETTMINAKTDDWISDHIYKKYTETDSRPLSPDITQYRINRKNGHPRITKVLHIQRKCLTPEPPETKQCHFHNRRVLILDLRRVKSVDIMARQYSLGSAGSGSGFDGEDDLDNAFSALPRLSSQSFSVSRSATPNVKSVSNENHNMKPPLPDTSESSKNLEPNTIPPLHSSVLALLGHKSGKPSPRLGLGVGTIAPQENFVTNRQKKLRRHGRRRKSGTCERDEEDNKVDPNSENLKDAEGSQDNEKVEDGTTEEKNLQEVSMTPYIPLYQILDDSLCKKRWYLPQDQLESEVKELKKALGKSELKFRQMNLSENLFEMSIIPPNTSKKRLAFLEQSIKEKDNQKRKPKTVCLD